MGNNCICSHYQNTQNINEDLSNNINKLSEYDLIEKIDNEAFIKSEFDMKSNKNSTFEKKLIDIYNLQKKTTLTSDDITKLNKIIRGHLFRKKYGNLKKELEKFNENLLQKFKEKSKNQKVENTINDNNNILFTNWNEFYLQDPIEEINKEISKTKKYVNGIKIKYINNNTPTSDSLDEIIENIESIYKGEINIITGEKIGNGEELYKNGSTIIGTFYKNKPYGWDKYINENGILYIGLFKNGKLNGKGIQYIKDENNNITLYKGDFIDGLKNGEGIEENENGKYEGHFENDKKNGKGKFYFNKGDYYEGDFKDNIFNGKGHFIWKKNGNEYIGEYTDGIMDGEGLYKWNDKQYYKGHYKNGIKEGKGEIKYSDGKKFICEFKNGKPNGIGIFVDSKGNEREVEFINGKINKNFKGSRIEN